MKAIRNALSVSAYLLTVGFALPGMAMEVQIVQREQQDEANKPIVQSLQVLLEALASKDLKKISDCLSDEVTVCDSAKNGVIYGKDAVMQHIKKNVLGTSADTGAQKIVVHHPYVTIKNDTAMVSFYATKQLAGSRPQTLESWCSEVYERSGKDWKVIYFRSNWKPTKSTKQS
jgi:hypothetical protein